MHVENLVLLGSFLGLLLTKSLICLNNIWIDSEKRMKEPVDILGYFKVKEKGDFIYRIISKQLEIKDHAA